MNINGSGHTLAIIRGGKYNNHVVGVDKEEKKGKYSQFKQMALNKDALFEPYPNILIDPETKKPMRDTTYISGQSGSGKSTYLKKYVLNYRSAFPNNKIFLFSKLRNDDTLKDIKVSRFIIDNRLITEPISYTDFPNSLIIYDDIDTINNKAIKQALDNFMNDILELGRHENISFVYCSHRPCRGKQTSTILNEARSIVIFPQVNNYKRLLTEYLDFNLKQVYSLKNFKSRWVCIHRSVYPATMVFEKFICFKSEYMEWVDKKQLDDVIIKYNNITKN